MSHARIHHVGHWLPQDQKRLDSWLAALVDDVSAQKLPLHPAVQELEQLIESDARIYMLFHRMFEELPKKPSFLRDPSGAPQVRDYHTLLQVISALITRAPTFDKSGTVALPLNAVLDWPMGTPAGAAVFLDTRLNCQLRKILNEWSRYLASPDSATVLDDHPQHGWFGKDALEAMPHFAEQFVCDPSRPHWGFTSWDDFFTRRFREGARPVADPDDTGVIINACESSPYRLAHDVDERARFWLKGQQYSLAHMLANDPRTPAFVGGTVYQAFLSALNYHRWHAPVTGTVVKTELVEGSYYAQARVEGLDRQGIHDSQGYLAETATRALVFIQADHPDIGLMCFMGVGMAEVSTCEIGVYEGQQVKKGDPLGAFHYGGSTYCLLFRPQTKLQFDLHGKEPGLHSSNILVNARLAKVA